MTLWLVMIAAGLLTYLTRLSFIYLYGKIKVPGLLQRSLRFVPPAVLSAILLPELFYSGGDFDLSVGNDRLLAGLAAIAVGAWTKNTLVTILAGFAALLGLRLLRGGLP